MESRLLVGLILPLVVTGCGSSTSSDAGPQPAVLLAQRPVLPATYLTADGEQAIDWGKEPGDGSADLRTCDDGKGAFRAWSAGGVEWGAPGVDHSVCVFATEAKASSTYSSQSLLDVGGEDWPNFEPNSDAETVPKDGRSLDGLAADEWEVGCGIGEPDSGCAVWTYRARHGRVLTEVEFAASPGAIRFEQMRDLVLSVDREVAARVSEPAD